VNVLDLASSNEMLFKFSLVLKFVLGCLVNLIYQGVKEFDYFLKSVFSRRFLGFKLLFITEVAPAFFKL
jgi:hypothetical protein